MANRMDEPEQAITDDEIIQYLDALIKEMAEAKVNVESIRRVESIRCRMTKERSDWVKIWKGESHG